MEESWENFLLHMELDCGDESFTDNVNIDDGDDYFIDNINIDDGDDFLRQITLETPQSDENDSLTGDVNGGVEVVNNMIKGNSSISIVSEQQQEPEPSKNVGARSCLPKTFILSFDNSTIIPATTPEPCVNLEAKRDSKNKRNRESSEKKEKVVKKARSSFQCADHLIAERKRRQELTERFSALSATIPGLSKVDKASILRAAVDYVKQLKERIDELEKQDKNVGVTSMMVLNKPNIRGIINNNEDKNSDDDDCNKNMIPEVEAREMGKEVLIEIHCEKQIGIELKVLKHIENLKLFVTGISVLPFGKSDLSITIIAQMGDGYELRVDDLVKSLRGVHSNGI